MAHFKEPEWELRQRKEERETKIFEAREVEAVAVLTWKLELAGGRPSRATGSFLSAPAGEVDKEEWGTLFLLARCWVASCYWFDCSPVRLRHGETDGRWVGTTLLEKRMRDVRARQSVPMVVRTRFPFLLDSPRIVAAFFFFCTFFQLFQK
jgi:hypothetical protein